MANRAWGQASAFLDRFRRVGWFDLFLVVGGGGAVFGLVAQRVLLPLLDILQSIPVPGFMPGVVLALVALFPGSNAGLDSERIASITCSGVTASTICSTRPRFCESRAGAARKLRCSCLPAAGETKAIMMRGLL